jgi:hypothetical protein
MSTRILRQVIFLLAVILFFSEASAQIPGLPWRLATRKFRAVQITPSGNNLFGIGTGIGNGIYLLFSTNGGTSWEVGARDVNVSGFAIGPSGRFYLSSPAGLSISPDPILEDWQLQPVFNLPSPITALFVKMATDGSADDEIWVGTTQGLWFRKFSDTLWVKKFDPADGMPIIQITASGTSMYFRTNSIVYASHKGAEFKNITPVSFGAITGILAPNEDDLWLTVNGSFSGSVFFSPNGGEDGFANLDNRNASFSARSIRTISSNNHGDVFVGGGVKDEVKQDLVTNGFIEVFPKNGNGWISFSDSLPVSPPSPEVISLGFGSDQFGYAGTDSAGLWKTTGKTKVREEMVFSNGLSQNYPNPANSLTEFTVTTTKDLNCSINIFDALGRKLYSVHEGSLTLGNHKFTIDTKDMANGTYFYRLQTPQATESKIFMVSH